MLRLILPPIIVIVAFGMLLFLMFQKLPEMKKKTVVPSDDITISRHSIAKRLSRFFFGVVKWLAWLLKAMLFKLVNTCTSIFFAVRDARLRAAQLRVDQKSNHVDDIDERSDKDVPELTTLDKQNDSNDNSPSSQGGVGKVAEDVDVPLVPVSQESDSVRPSHQKYQYRRTDVGRHGIANQRRFDRLEKAINSARVIEEALPMKKDQMEDILVERISLNPRDIEAYERLGDYYLEQKNLIDAKECYRQVLKLSPAYRLVKIKIRRLERLLEKGGVV